MLKREWEAKNKVDFDTQEFDPDMFQKRVGAVAKLVKTYKDSGVADFKTLATRMSERFPEKYGAMKPYLRGVWNAVAEQMNLPEVSRSKADEIYGIIEAQSNEATMNENYNLENNPEWIPTKEQEEAGITVSDLMREYPPPEEEDSPEEFWPVDEYGLKIPMNEWGVSELGMFPDKFADWLKAELRKNSLPAAAKLLEELSPSQIAQEPREANVRLGEILQEMGLLAPELKRYL